MIALRRAQVDYDNLFVAWIGIAIPMCAVVWMHWRHRLSPLVAALANYVIGVCAAFCSGCLFYHFRNQQPREEPFIFRFVPMDEAFRWMLQAAAGCIVISAVYFVAASIIQRVKTKSVA